MFDIWHIKGQDIYLCYHQFPRGYLCSPSHNLAQKKIWPFMNQFCCSLYTTVPALRLTPNNTSTAPKTPGSKADGRRLLLFSQGSGRCKLCSKNVTFFFRLLYSKVDKIELKSLRETGPTAILGQPAILICWRRGKATEAMRRDPLLGGETPRLVGT